MFLIKVIRLDIVDQNIQYCQVLFTTCLIFLLNNNNNIKKKIIKTPLENLEGTSGKFCPIAASGSNVKKCSLIYWESLIHFLFILNVLIIVNCRYY